ncbi:MAG: hypothetical protein KBE65_20610 [Phycisphaerae bacterium]|nr:hypothetical protein [Phycisphaerae bacterium]
MHNCAKPLPRVPVTTTRNGAGCRLLLVLGMTVQACGAPRELPDARVGVAYEYAVVYQGLVEPVKAEWRGLPDWLTADGPRVRGTPRTVTQKPLEFSVTLTGQIGDPLQSQFRLRIRPAIRPLALVKSAIPPLPIDEPISIGFSANGGEGKLKWDVRWISRIPGIDAQIDNAAGTCRLMGTATTEGQFDIQVIVCDETDATDQHQFHSQTRALAVPLRITSARLSEATFSHPYVAHFAAEGGRPPYKWKTQWQASPPPGLTVIPEEGRIAGTPTYLGEYPFLVTLEDTVGTQKQASGNFIVVPPPCSPFLVGDRLPAATAGQPFEATLCAGGLVADTQWTVSGAPPWLRWENTGQVACHLSATPPESGSWNITVALSVTAPVRTQSGESVREIGKASHVFTLHVSPRSIPPLRFIEPHPPMAVQNQPYEYRFVAEGGDQPVRFTFTGELPNSIITDANGVILASSMSEAGTSQFTVTATSADEQRQQYDCVLRVLPAEHPSPLTIADVPRVDALFFQKSVFCIPVRGGMPPYAATIESCPGMEALPCDVKDGVAFQLRHPLGGKMLVRVLDSAGQSAAASVTVHPVIPLVYVVPAGLVLLAAVCGAMVRTLRRSMSRLRRHTQAKPASDATTRHGTKGKADERKGKQEPKRHRMK